VLPFYPCGYILCRWLFLFGQVLIGEETAQRVEKSFSMSSLGVVPLKNIKNPGEIFEVSSILI